MNLEKVKRFGIANFVFVFGGLFLFSACNVTERIDSRSKKSTTDSANLSTEPSLTAKEIAGSNDVDDTSTAGDTCDGTCPAPICGGFGADSGSGVSKGGELSLSGPVEICAEQVVVDDGLSLAGGGVVGAGIGAVDNMVGAICRMMSKTRCPVDPDDLAKRVYAIIKTSPLVENALKKGFCHGDQSSYDAIKALHRLLNSAPYPSSEYNVLSNLLMQAVDGVRKSSKFDCVTDEEALRIAREFLNKTGVHIFYPNR